MENQKTIKQLADELGVSKQAVWQKIKRDTSTDLRQLMIKKGNTVYVSIEGQNIIKSMFHTVPNNERQHVDDNKNVDVDDSVDEIIFLRELINDLQDEKKELYKLLDQQQILTLQANKKIEELELKNESDEKIKSENDPTEENNYDESKQHFSSSEIEKEKKNSSSFWKKLFRKEK
ncbi:DUF536 domain-containing protein [Enterococcus sp. AZ189]|uniref:DUF536 domain-containing protein n=1 Tax=Enterococcus sp. AZ189 TaxID=2774871 RepID=UPI003F264801